MSRTFVVPNRDALTQTPMPVGGRPSGPGSHEELPTLRVPVAPSVGPSAPVAPRAIALTPPPLDDLRLSVSAWSANNDAGSPSATRAPRVGDTILGFRLIGELGRGAFARVFLARQEALADRPVALKVTLRPTREAERLARLQHTNVVPVYSVHNDDPTQLICMPYLGRTTLADLIRAYRIDHPSRQSGRKSTSARAARPTSIESKSKSAPKSATDSKGNSGATRVPTWTWSADERPPIVGEPRPVLEVLAQLAAGLAHAHDRGILHLDIKPANVLLADTGEPMLLDFNLSFDASRPDRELVGGTMPYMAIEQLRDMRDRGKGVLDCRTDLYSLGVLAFELLTGSVPFPASHKQLRDIDGQVAARKQGPPALRPLNPDVTPAVEAVVRKLLAADPADRYQTAEELRTDITRHLADQPLLYAREGPSRERLGKWRRRNPGVPLRLTVACVIGLALGLGFAVQRRAEATARYEAVERAKDARAALETTRLDLVLPNDPAARARGVKRATELLATYDLPGDADWQKRPDVRRLDGAERGALAGDLGELMILLAQVKWEQADARPEAERRELVAEAWKLNAAARACFGDSPPPLAARQAAAIAPAAGETFEVNANAEPAPGPRDLFLDAQAALVTGRYAEAIPLLDRVIAAQPSHAAAQFCLAFCRQQAGEFARALERYDVARVLLPTDPRPAYQRAQIYLLMKKPALAEEEFSKAIARDPNHADAYRYRGLTRYRLGVEKGRERGGDKESAAKFAGAESDLTDALERGAPAMFVHCVRTQVRDARGDIAGAMADRTAIKNAVLKTEGDYFVRGWSRMKPDPKGAVADFQKALEINPRSLVALQNLAHVLGDHLKDLDAALVVATKTAELFPEYAPALAGKALVLARLGRRAEAHKEIERARMLSDDAEVTYLAAAVYAVTGATNADDHVKAITLLRKAIREGYSNLSGMAADADFASLRKSPDFLAIQQSAATLYK